MIPLLKHFWNDLWNDEQAARRLTRGLLLGYVPASVTLGVMLAASPLWVRLVIFVSGGLAGLFGGLISVGQMNPTDAKTTAAVDRDLATVGTKLVVEPGPVIPASADPQSNPPGAP
jgi:hypothetical protein